jgi:hypothetical protein
MARRSICSGQDIRQDSFFPTEGPDFFIDGAARCGAARGLSGGPMNNRRTWMHDYFASRTSRIFSRRVVGEAGFGR